jgi:hypothetical protein
MLGHSLECFVFDGADRFVGLIASHYSPNKSPPPCRSTLTLRDEFQLVMGGKT